MHVVVLGAGILGVSSAWYLRQEGHEVTVVERQPGAALETSFANGSQLSVGHVEPWASLETLPQLWKWGFSERAPVLFRPRADLAQWQWGAQFFLECWPARNRHNLRELLNLGLYSRAAQQALRAETGIEFQAIDRGILNLYATPSEWARGSRAAAEITRLGYPRHRITREEALRIEPALGNMRAPWVGATYTPGDGSGDAHQWTQVLAEKCRALGVVFHFNQSVLGLAEEAGRITGVRLAGRETLLGADAVVAALGSYTPLLLRPHGIRIPVYPVKGYSATVPLLRPEAAPQVSITDDAWKMVFSRLGDTLRIAGTAEFTGYDTRLNEARCNALIERARLLFPEAADYGQPTFWAGLRPATPSNRPLIGRTRIPNLFLNTGHGTLGWTTGCGSGKALAAIVSGRRPEVDFSFSGL
ncbi:MAG: D-amino acid dehydrogenase [Betaproteobacteria bacterium]|nr:D-amino acid dehydrogenase [Betaproteobacteria bacterium]